MVESSDDPSLSVPSFPKAHVSSFRRSGADRRPALSLTNPPSAEDALQQDRYATGGSHRYASNTAGHDVAEERSSALPPPGPPPTSEEPRGEEAPTIEWSKKPNIVVRFYATSKDILLSSYINILLVFVPVGIAINFTNVSPTVVFAMNAIAIIPLAKLLCYATDSVALSMGDTIGALMNITFGNAVELIIFMYVILTKLKTTESQRLPLGACNSIASHGVLPQQFPHVFYIALVKNKIRIVQASLLGSILANLMLILGMCFLCGGLRFQEQIYNATVTQMSACLLSLSVMSLLLPTAFHASFSDNSVADVAVLRVSRGSSIILLLVYVLYLLFQLKSHAYMYQSTPQHVIDEESHPGLLADMLGNSSSSDTAGSSNGTDTDDSSGSNTTAKRIRRAFRGRRRRKSSASSKDTPSMPSAVRTPSVGTFHEPVLMRSPTDSIAQTPLNTIASGDEADTDSEHDARPLRLQVNMPSRRDFQEKMQDGTKSPESQGKRTRKGKHRKHHHRDKKQAELSEKIDPPQRVEQISTPLSQRVSFMHDVHIMPEVAPKRPFNLRGISVRPAIPKMLTSTVFSVANPCGPPDIPLSKTTVPPAPYGLRRATSLPDRLNKAQSAPSSHPQQDQQTVHASTISIHSEASHEVTKRLSRTSAVLLLLISTALVAVCAEFLVSSISYLVGNTGVSEEFIGLIILPIIGNAAEHFTAVTVASKNKMDLAIGVAVGSSIQISLFVTPVIVLLGWALGKDMSLYFSIFETIALFVSAFIVNFLVLDGRSNYLEGALLIAAYVIIAVAAFFYPDSSQQSSVGGAPPAVAHLMF